MDSKILRQKPGRSRQGEILEPIADEVEYEIVADRVELEIRKVLRINPLSLNEVMTSFAKWAKKWE